MTKVGALCAALLMLVPFSASAHGPTRQKVVQSVEINAPADKVWAVVGKFSDMSWHPTFPKSEGTGNEPGATRKLTTKDGGTIEEKLTKFDAAGKTMSTEMPKVDVKVLPVENYSATFTVKDAGGKATVEWKTAFYRGYANNDPPPELSDEAAVNAITNLVKTGLEGLKSKLEAGG
jgi:hypothetical protein